MALDTKQLSQVMLDEMSRTTEGQLELLSIMYSVGIIGVARHERAIDEVFAGELPREIAFRRHSLISRFVG